MNPWTSIPLDDYESHMQSESVRQLEPLSSLFGSVLRRCAPASVAILGIAGGNGLEHIDRAVTKRVVGVDINSGYLENVQRRYADLSGLELHCTDLSAEPLQIPPVQLVHAALIFEHAGIDRCLANAAALVAPVGYLSVVLQLPSAAEEAVTPTGYASIRRLKDHFTLIDPTILRQQLAKFGLRQLEESRSALPGGKAFWFGLFCRHENARQ